MINVFIIAATTLDGFVARKTNELADWTSKEDKKLFVQLTKRAGVMIMGSTTYKTIGRPLPGRRNIVYTSRTIDQEGIETTSKPPKELISQLEKEGFSEVAICGGSSIYDQFLRAGLVDELYVTIEPVLFGDGVPLLKSPGDQKLKLKSHRQLNENVLLINYEVAK